MLCNQRWERNLPGKGTGTSGGDRCVLSLDSSGIVRESHFPKFTEPPSVRSILESADTKGMTGWQVGGITLVHRIARSTGEWLRLPIHHHCHSPVSQATASSRHTISSASLLAGSCPSHSHRNHREHSSRPSSTLSHS